MQGECGIMQGRCVCIVSRGHETPHVCSCGGSFMRHGDELSVFALPPGREDHVKLTSDEALTRANEYAKSEPLFRETLGPPRTSRTLIKYFRVGDADASV